MSDLRAPRMRPSALSGLRIQGSCTLSPRETAKVYKCTPMSPNDPSSLPPQRAAVLDFLRRELAGGRAPSLAEIADEFGFSSRNAAQKHVQALVADGLLEQVPGRTRGLRLPGGGADLQPLPVLGRVAAGLPISPEGVARLGPVDEGGEALWLDRRLFSPRPDYL